MEVQIDVHDSVTN